MDAVTKLRYIQARKRIEEINDRLARQKKIMLEYGGYDTGLFVIFKEPFSDIFSALKLSAMDISNGLQRFVKAIWHLGDPKKLAEDKKVYDQKRSILLREWEPIVKRSIDSIKSADPFLTIGLMPHLFLATKGASAALAIAQTSAEIGFAQNWPAIRDKYQRWFEKSGRERDADRARGSDPSAIEAAEELTKIRKMLQDLFYGKDKSTAVKKEGLLREQSSSIDPNKDPVEFLRQFFEDTGMAAEFADATGRLLKEKLELTQKSLDALEELLPLMRLVSIQELDKFNKELQQILTSKNLSPDLMNDFKKMIPGIEEQAKKLAADDDFKAQISKSSKKAEKKTDEELLKIAKDYAFTQAKENFDKKVNQQIKNFEPVLKNNDKDITIDQKTLDLLKKNSENIFSAPDFLKVYDQYEKAYKEFKSLVG